MFCEKCGSQINDGVAFFSSCGNPTKNENTLKEDNAKDTTLKQITGNFTPISSHIPLQLLANEIPIEQNSAAFVESSIAQGTLTLTNKRILFTKDSAGKAFLKRGGLLGMALSSGANIPTAIPLDDVICIQSTSCIQGKAAMLITVRSGYKYKIALQSMKLGKNKELCATRDRIVNLIASVL